MEEKLLKKKAFQRRLEVLEMVYASGSGHIGGSMSCMDLLTVLYYEVLDLDKIRSGAEDRDRFILSKGHCAEALYTILADQGFFEKAELSTYAKFDTRLPEHPTRHLPGIEIGTGALGHGLCVGVGMALGLQRDRNPAHVYLLMGDGEQEEGSNWEGAMAAAKYRLDNLTAIIDRNRLQISGNTEEVMPLDDLKEKYCAFGWDVLQCDGHNYPEILRALQYRSDGKPVLIIANTIKGYGSAVMENKADWHHLIPNQEQYQQIKADLLRHLQEV